MSETNNQIAQEQTEELMKHTKAELVELLQKEQRKVTKHKKDKADLRKELKENEEFVAQAAEINKNNEEYLQGLNQKLNHAEARLIDEGQTLSEVVASISAGLDLIELGIRQTRKAIQYNLSQRGKDEE